jgi:pectate disaccharide-lyase
MPGYALRFCLLPLAVWLCVGSCLSTEGYYRYQDAGVSGAAGTAGTAGPGTAGSGVAGATGSGGSSGGSAAGTTGAAGTVATGRGGTTGMAGRGGTTGTAGTGVTGGGGSGAILFMDDFETGKTWDWAGDATHAVVADGATNHVFELNSMMSKQSLAAYTPTGATADHSIEARVKVLSWNGSSSSYVAALCVRLSGPASFYYLAIQSNDGKLKIKYNNGSNSSIGTSLDGQFAVNTWITLKLSVVGSTLTAYANGVMLGQETDANITSGTSVGLMVDNARAQFDDVIVRAP